MQSMNVISDIMLSNIMWSGIIQSLECHYEESYVSECLNATMCGVIVLSVIMQSAAAISVIMMSNSIIHSL
jgi:hypothetical protein